MNDLLIPILIPALASAFLRAAGIGMERVKTHGMQEPFNVRLRGMFVTTVGTLLMRSAPTSRVMQT